MRKTEYGRERPQKPREIASRILRRREARPVYVEDLLEDELATTGLSPRDRSLTRELVYGVVRWLATLDWLIEQRTDGRQQRADIQVLLRLGLYQLFWLDRIPDHAAVHETVQMARALAGSASAGFVNATLRGCLRDRAAIERQLESLRENEPAIGWSHPAWLVGRWVRRWGKAVAGQLLEWNNRPAETFARVNTLKTQSGPLLDRWRQEGVEYDFGRWPWIPENNVFLLKSHPHLSQLPSFRDGWFYVQDPSTWLAVQLLAPSRGDRILDLCAAPGGKTTLLAQRLGNEGTILAVDAAEDRVGRVLENCQRLGVTCVTTQLNPVREQADPTTLPVAGWGEFDRVMVDAPCSNTGVMRRRVDLRWRVRPDALERLADGQRALISQAAAHVRSGGRLVYSTCSLEPEENGEIVRHLLASRPDLRLEEERGLTPMADQVDGAYVAVLSRV